MGMTRREFARAVLCASGISFPRVTALNVVTAWCYSESGKGPADGTNAPENNPLNATLATAGTRIANWNSVPVRNYITIGDGIAATSVMLRQPNMAAILTALDQPNLAADSVCHTIGSSPWGTDGVLLLAVMQDYKKDPLHYDRLPV